MVVGFCGIWVDAGEKSPIAITSGITDLPNGLILRDQNGQYVKLNELCYPGTEKPRFPRRVVLLNFMSSECAPCRAELPELLAFLHEVGTNRVAGFLISLDPLSKGDQLSQFLKEMAVDCRVLLDPYKLAAKKLGVMDKDGGGSIPRTFIFAPDGRMVGHINGKPDNLGMELKNALDKADK